LDLTTPDVLAAKRSSTWLRPASSSASLVFLWSPAGGASSASPQRWACWRACNAVEIARIVRLSEPADHLIDESPGFESHGSPVFNTPTYWPKAPRISRASNMPSQALPSGLRKLRS